MVSPALPPADRLFSLPGPPPLHGRYLSYSPFLYLLLSYSKAHTCNNHYIVLADSMGWEMAWQRQLVSAPSHPGFSWEDLYGWGWNLLKAHSLKCLVPGLQGGQTSYMGAPGS